VPREERAGRYLLVHLAAEKEGDGLLPYEDEDEEDRRDRHERDRFDERLGGALGEARARHEIRFRRLCRRRALFAHHRLHVIAHFFGNG
jgi:hypothetical protein